MSYNHVQIKRFRGLFLQPNTFQVPDGAMEDALNCVISEDDVVKKIRGNVSLYSPSVGTINNGFTYQNETVLIFNTKAEWVNSAGTATVLGGETIAASSRVVRGVEQNKNLYFTTNGGIYKLTAYNSVVTKAGIPPALDLRGYLYTAASNFLSTGKQVGYRVLFGKKDANDQLLLGAPSDFLYLSNNSGVDQSARIEFSIPSEITTTDYFFQVYRSSQVLVANDVLPDYKLIKERVLTASELSSGIVFFNDSISDIFQSEAVELYTNPNSREGELQANTRPPLAEDIVLFKNQVFYINATTRALLSFNLVSVSASFIVSGDYVEIKQGSTTRRYVARTGVGNNTVSGTVAGTTTLTVTYVAHGLLVGDTVYISNAAGGAPNATQGSYTITAVTANTFTFVANVGANSTTLDFQGITNGTNPIFELFTTGATLGENIDTTARGIVKAINRDALSPVYARYLSSNASVPGQIVIESKTFDTNAVQIRANSTTSGGAFAPELPAAFGTSFQSDNQSRVNSIFVSKIGECEAVPLENELIVGSANKRALRGFALQDSVLILKDDGVFRIDGDSIRNFQVTIVDNTVFCLAPSTAVRLDNKVYSLTNQGVIVASPNGCEVVSRFIELPISAVLGNSNLSSISSGVGYESERLYFLTTLTPNSNTDKTVYVYNTLTQSWTYTDFFFSQGFIGPSNKLYFIRSNIFFKERKNQNKLDYTLEEYSATVTSVASDSMSAILSVPTYVPQIGDVVVLNNVISRIRTVTSLGSNAYNLGFEFLTNLTAAASVTVYQKILSRIKFSPFHAGQTNRMKQFAQFQVQAKDSSISKLEINFSTDSFGSDEAITWRKSDLTASGLGWGNEAWGLFPWGDEDGINLTYSTQPAPIIRTYVPRFTSRATYIQAILTHDMGAEPMNIQAIGYQLRGYDERTTK